MTLASSVRSELPDSFVEALHRALAPNQASRFESAREFHEALKGVLVVGTRKSEQLPRAAGVKVSHRSDPHTSMAKVFISYCHDDHSTIDRLDLMSYFGDLNSDECSVWSDRSLGTGDDWNSVLIEQLQSSNILVPIVTQAYLRSRYCQEIEIAEFWSRRVEDGLVIFPLILSPCEWQRFKWLQSTQFLPRMGTVMTHYKGRAKRDQLMVSALGELRAIARRFIASRQSSA